MLMKHVLHVVVQVELALIHVLNVAVEVEFYLSNVAYLVLFKPKLFAQYAMVKEKLMIKSAHLVKAKV